MSFTSFMVRAIFKSGDDQRDQGLETPEDILRFDDIVYGPDPKWNVLDIYRPKDGSDKLPVIVSVHGGGWVYGDKERYQYYCMSLAQHGFAVVNFTYRLAPKHKFPAQLEDTNAVFRWVLENAEEYGFDKEHVFAVGDSAGAHLLGLYACLCTDPDYGKTYTLPLPEGFSLKALALNCGVYLLRSGGRRDLTARLMGDLLPKKGTKEELDRIRVIDHVSAAFPPSFVMTCEGDFLAEEAPPLVEKLQGLGVPVTYRYYGDPEHPLGHVFHCDVRSEEAQACNREECEFFRSFL